MKKSNLSLLLTLTTFLSQTGCNLLVGNIKPVDEKSSTYSILDLSSLGPEWVKTGAKTESSDSGVPDEVYQSQKTSSVISVNSVCKSYKPDQQQDLNELTHQLLLGISEITSREDKKLIIDRVPALQTTIQGKLNNETVLFRTVVLQKNNCIYDLIYVSKPDHFKINEGDFSKFVSSLRLR